MFIYITPENVKTTNWQNWDKRQKTDKRREKDNLQKLTFRPVKKHRTFQNQAHSGVSMSILVCF